MVYILQTAMKLGCIYALVSLALFMSFRILKIADMTTDGCFILGGAVSVGFALTGHPFVGLILARLAGKRMNRALAMLAGSSAGLITAVLQTRMGVPSILAGIITNTGLYTINLMVMGFSSNLSLLKGETVFSVSQKMGIFGKNADLIVSAVIVIDTVASVSFHSSWFINPGNG